MIGHSFPAKGTYTLKLCFWTVDCCQLLWEGM